MSLDDFQTFPNESKTYEKLLGFFKRELSVCISICRWSDASVPLSFSQLLSVMQMSILHNHCSLFFLLAFNIYKFFASYRTLQFKSFCVERTLQIARKMGTKKHFVSLSYHYYFSVAERNWWLHMQSGGFHNLELESFFLSPLIWEAFHWHLKNCNCIHDIKKSFRSLLLQFATCLNADDLSPLECNWNRCR